MGAMNSLPPGFRFHPTDEELVAYYLQRKLTGRSIELDIIPEVDLYKCEPWDLPDKSLLASKDMEWYFFSPRDRKYPNGSRTNRATRGGYWKATGKDRIIHVSNNVMNSSSSSSPENKKETLVGTKKTLVFYRGRAPHGIRTNWVMHEYRLLHHSIPSSFSSLKDSYSLCRVFKKTIQIPEMPKEEDQKKGSIMRMSSEEKLVIEEDNNHHQKVVNHHDHCCTSNNNKLVIPNGDASSSDLTQGTPTHQTGFIDDFQPQFASDEANSNNNAIAINHSYSLGIDYYPSNLFQDVEVGVYGGMHDEIPAYSTLEMEDFPQINIAETKAMKQYEMSGHCILFEKYKDCMNGTLEEIIALCSSDHQDIYNN